MAASSLIHQHRSLSWSPPSSEGAILPSYQGDSQLGVIWLAAVYAVALRLPSGCSDCCHRPTPLQFFLLPVYSSTSQSHFLLGW